MKDLIADLDGYFAEKYANYDKICVLNGYVLPKMHYTDELPDGRKIARTMPPETMRLSNQENVEEKIAQLKSKFIDKSFSFTFMPIGFFERIQNKFYKYSFLNLFKQILAKCHLTFEQAKEGVEVSDEIWKNVKKGKFLLTKNMIFSLALTCPFSVEDTTLLLYACGFDWDYSLEKDVVIDYLLTKKVYNPAMVQACLEEYHIANLFIKKI